MRAHYIRYASYVILDRAIPELLDGLKPVQRRILHTLFTMHDGKFHKVANVTGQTMAFHPHGDAPIYEALVTLANKLLMLDTQGNFGNTLTGDPAAAARYIETRLSQLALETMFNPQLTSYTPSYDGRNKEPVILPAKLPLLLLQGADGIAVGMSTKVLPHNFQEVLQAEIDLIEGRPIKLLPDFPTGGIVDASGYQDGKGKVRVRAKITTKDPKTLIIEEIPYGTTTESLIQSIEEAAKKGQLKIDSISDYTASRVEIEIKLPRGVYAEDVVDALYGYTDCEISIQPQMVVIHQDSPREVTVTEALETAVASLKSILEAELRFELAKVRASIFAKTLERIFIEERLYKLLEEVDEPELVYGILREAFLPYQDELIEEITKEAIDQLLSIPIRRIARFDREKNLTEIQDLEKRKKILQKSLQDINGHAVNYIKGLLKKYGSQFPRRTVCTELQEVDKRAISTKNITVGVDIGSGYVGTKLDGPQVVSCTNHDKLAVFYSDGTYKVFSIPEKQFIGKKNLKIVLVTALDKEAIFSCCYRDVESGLAFAKRFQVKQFILDKEYRYFEENSELLILSQAKQVNMQVSLVPKSKQRVAAFDFAFDQVRVKGVQAQGIRVHSRPIMEIKQLG